MSRKRSSGRGVKSDSEIFFNNACEEKTALLYVANIIDSWLTQRYPDIVFGLAASILGVRTIHRFVDEVHPGIPFCSDSTILYNWMKNSMNSDIEKMWVCYSQ